MLNLNLLSKSVKYSPLLMSGRWKVTILPKETYDYNVETEFMKPQKPKKKMFMDVMCLLQRKNKNLTYAHLKNHLKWKKFNAMRDDQRYLPDRHKFLGPDLATTHFITKRGGRIKFVNNDKWITYDDITEEKVPSFFVPGFSIEEIDVSGTNLCYEGFDNLGSLAKLKKLNLSNCPFIDDWCLGRSHIFANTLEQLDISGCHLVTERGICALHPLKKLKTLVMNDTPNIQNKELVVLLLQDIIPKCEVIGVDLNDPVLMKRVENFMH